MDEKVHNEIYKIYKNNGFGEGIEILVRLDPYGDRLIEVEKLKLIIYDIRKGIPLDKIH